MNILHLSPFVPDIKTSHAGGVCMGKQVETLKQDNHVACLTFMNNEFEERLLSNHPDYQYVKTSKWSFIGNVLLHPFLPNMFAVRASKKYKEQVRTIIRKNKIDAVHAEYTSMGQYYWIKKEYPNIKFNIVEHDVTYQSYQRQTNEAKGLKKLYLKIETKKVKKCEKEYLNHADIIFTFNEKDKNLLKDIYGRTNVEVLNPYYGVDFDNVEVTDKVPGSICFIGQMGRDENHVAAMRLIHIFQMIYSPKYQLTIIGAHPKEELLKMESKNIHITGFVDDINKEIQKNEIAVFPLTYGAGIKLKVLLAFGLGIPVVTSSIGAEGIDPTGKVLCLAETDEEFAEQIKKLLSNPELLKRKSTDASEYVRTNFGWDRTVEVFREVYSN